MKVQQSIGIDKEQLEKLRELANKKYTSMSALVRQAIANLLEKEKNEVK